MSKPKTDKFGRVVVAAAASEEQSIAMDEEIK